MSLFSQVSVVRPRHVIWGAAWMALLASGGVLQTHLRFGVRDLDIQTRNAQVERASLRDDRVALASQIAKLRSHSAVPEQASEMLGLEMATPTRVKPLQIRESVWDRYKEESDEGVGDMTRQNSSWKQLLQKVPDPEPSSPEG